MIWEIREIVGRVAPEKVILCMSLDMKTDGPDHERWKTFHERTQGIFRKGLPQDIGRGEFVYFDEDWTPRVLTPFRDTPPPQGATIRDSALRNLFAEFLHVSSPYGLRAAGKSLGFLLVMLGTVLAAALSLNPILHVIEHGTFGVFPSTREVVDDYRPRYDQLRDKLVRIAAKLPPPGVADRTHDHLSLDPVPVFTMGEISNTEFMMEEALLDPEVFASFWVGHYGDMKTALAWTAPDRFGNNNRAKPGYYETLDAGLEITYLIVHRVLGLEGTEPITSENFDRRALIAEGFLIDLRTEEILESWWLRAEPHTYKYHWDPLTPYSPYSVTLEQQLAELLRDLTGGEFDLR